MIKKAVFFFVLPLLILALGLFVWLPSSHEIKGCLRTKMYQIDLCPGSKNYVPLNQISKHLQNAIIITEDSAFYTHNGFDQEGIERCFEKFKEKKRIVCGGSTITQQLAKNMFLYKEKNFFRKGLEALVTIQIEKTLNKKQIFERYLNVIQFGKNIFGIQQAALAYFRKSPALLSVQEAAFLAMILPNPEKYSQSYYRKDLTKFARSRLTQIIENLHRYNRITPDEYVQATDGLDGFIRGGQKEKPTATEFDQLTIDDLETLEE